MARKARNNSQVWEQAWNMFRFDLEEEYDRETIEIAWEEADQAQRNDYYDEAEKVLREEGKL